MKTFHDFHCTLKRTTIKVKKFVLTYFKTVKAKESTQRKENNTAKESGKLATIENELAPQQRKSRPQNKASYVSHFKAVFV